MPPFVGRHGARDFSSLGVARQHFAHPSICVPTLAHRLEQIHCSTDLHPVGQEAHSEAIWRRCLQVVTPKPGILQIHFCGHTYLRRYKGNDSARKIVFEGRKARLALKNFEQHRKSQAYCCMWPNSKACLSITVLLHRTPHVPPRPIE